MGLSFSHILILAIIVVLLFGRGKISELMGDVAKGIKSFKKGMAEDDETAEKQRTIDHAPAATVAPVSPTVAVDATERERRSA